VNRNQFNIIVNYKKINKKTRITSGIVFIYENKILMVHPSNRNWNSEFSYPKGKVENNESIKKAAIREVKEEINIDTPNELLNQNLYKINSKDEEFYDTFKIDYYYLIYLDDYLFNYLFKGDLILKSKNLQKSEIDWAGFITKEQCQSKIKLRLQPILNHLY
jgi:8-oxo-dGTP pyrophosphatase MutT (NUDIX family)